MTLSIKLDPEVKRQLEEIAKQQNTSLNRLVLRYISQGIQADTGEPDRLAAIEARLDAIEVRLNEVSKQYTGTEVLHCCLSQVLVYEALQTSFS